MELKVHSYESMGTYDGPGLRLVVFLQGCPFRCLYCANPDTISFEGGTPTLPEAILKMALNQKPFFGKKGGVTFSGGEPTAQAEALVPLVRELQEHGINVCIDTNGAIWNSHVEELFSIADLVLLDVKQINPARSCQTSGPDGEEQYQDSGDSCMAGRTWQTVLAEICAGARNQRCGRRHPCIGRTFREWQIQDDTARGNTALPHTREKQIRSSRVGL